MNDEKVVQRLKRKQGVFTFPNQEAALAAYQELNHAEIDSVLTFNVRDLYTGRVEHQIEISQADASLASKILASLDLIE